jgi:mannose/fructose-specific phosphotransferase system component IIA
MSTVLRGVVAGHGEVATGLVRAVEEISGVHGALVPVSNTDCDRGALERRIAEAMGSGPGVVFVDMPSGSCLFAALHDLRGWTSVRVVTGVNLAMLLDFVFHRELDVDAAVARAVETGARSIVVR